MAIATTLKAYLDDHHVRYDVIRHAHSETALESARAASVPGHQIAKAVVLADGDGYVVGILPSTNRLDLSWLSDALGRELHMAAESELDALFGDCDHGAVPALGGAYGIDTVWDDQLANASDIYFEAGDHQHLVHMSGDEFRKLVHTLPHNIISKEQDYGAWMRD